MSGTARMLHTLRWLFKPPIPAVGSFWIYRRPEIRPPVVWEVMAANKHGVEIAAAIVDGNPIRPSWDCVDRSVRMFHIEFKPAPEPRARCTATITEAA